MFNETNEILKTTLTNNSVRRHLLTILNDLNIRQMGVPRGPVLEGIPTCKKYIDLYLAKTDAGRRGSVTKLYNNLGSESNRTCQRWALTK